MDKELQQTVKAAAPQFVAPPTIEETVTAVWATNLLDQYGLMPLWRLLQAENTAANLPYHNEQHLLNVVSWCGRLYFSESLAFAPDQLRCLLTAAMIHDVNHSGGKTKDSENIQRTLEWFMGIIQSVEKFELRDFLENHKATIIGLVTVTEFPFIHEPKTSLQKILRDADLLQNFGAHCVKYLKGLAMEFVTAGMELTCEEIIARQEVFMRDVKFYTYTGQAIKATVGKAVFEEQRDAFLKKVN